MHSSLFTSDIRLQIFTIYLGTKYKEFNEKNINEINDSFKVKDYLIIGNELFKEKIKSIERDLKAKSIKYLQIEQISHYINTKNEKDKNKAGNKNLIVYYYYLIITLKEFQENIEIILLLSAELGIAFFVLLYIEDEENKIIYHKNGISFILPIILVYSPEDIIKYISKMPDFEIPADEDDEIFNDLLNIKIPKISFRYDNEDDYQDVCFELAETFDTKIIKDKIVINYYGSILYNKNILKNIYLIYKEHNALDLFYKQNGIYFGTPLNNEFSCLDICFIKRILYMYCREEIDSKKSLYRMLNGDLRKRNPTLIFRYIDLLGITYKLIENEELAKFKGKVYRATKLYENLILKLKPGTIMVNTTFWSTSKDFSVAESFMEADEWRNSYIICEAVKNNIDIDFEDLNPFNMNIKNVNYIDIFSYAEKNPNFLDLNKRKKIRNKNI